MFFRQMYEEYCNVTFIRKSKTGGDLLLEIRKSTSLVNLLIPPCLFQLHRKHKKNSVLSQITYTFVGKYLTVIEVFTKNWRLVFDITQTFKGKNCSLKIRVQILLGLGSGLPRPLLPFLWLRPCPHIMEGDCY